MDLYFLHPDVHAKRYNCNVLSKEEWQQMGTKHEIMGVFTLVLGIVLYHVYLPFLATMLQPKFLHMSCYKLMFFLGVMDFFTITCGNTISGYLLTQGAVFCTHPNLIYFTGSFGIGSF
ncbi:serpentine type 7TM GPCR chemoreceptor srt domain-containing protein [Ditylenchus destructor]|uniref:Serpentine type 7TM GPCR chemoreceptor srt domain-containing protein n=1 Tax=Ditylenchus destructor TaxID=166010 RepID=A0AAD4R4V6_9BILA|nr:serpentine type 7TM GPCR chemoreceptor srt domain-containing protein [Ditylenchus destructor]